MTVLALKPTFTDRKSYNAWRDDWRLLYKNLSNKITKAKIDTKKMQRSGSHEASDMQSNLHYDRVVAHKAMSLLEEAKLRMKRIYEMEKQIKTQMESFPITIECKVLDFHYNKVHSEFSFMPMWNIRAKGNQYLINHFSADGIPWSTRETPEASTKGMLRFRNCSLTIDKEGNATISTIPKSDPIRVSVSEPVIKQTMEAA